MRPTVPTLRQHTIASFAIWGVSVSMPTARMALCMMPRS